MGRRPRDARIETREARSRLRRREEPYWRQIAPGLAVGYMKGARGGVWRFRQYQGGPSPYCKGKLGIADDYRDADGEDILNYAQAISKAIEKSKNPDEHVPADAKVQEVTQSYMEWHKAHSRNWRSTEYVIQKINKRFGSRKVSNLTTQAIRRWHFRLVEDSDDPEALRKQQATANRNLTVFKAALNFGWNAGMVKSADAWQRVKPFRDVDAPKVRFLNLAECKRLTNACPLDLRQMVRAALLTGCRYGELARVRVSDFDDDAAIVTLSHTKSGKTRHVPLTDEGRDFFSDAIIALNRKDLIFRRSDGEPWRKSNQFRSMRVACAAAKIEPPISFHVLRHTYGSLLAKEGVPLQVIAAALGHSDTRMTEKHYAHLKADHIAEIIRKSLPQFEETKKGLSVVRLSK